MNVQKFILKLKKIDKNIDLPTEGEKNKTIELVLNDFCGGIFEVSKKNGEYKINKKYILTYYKKGMEQIEFYEHTFVRGVDLEEQMLIEIKKDELTLIKKGLMGDVEEENNTNIPVSNMESTYENQSEKQVFDIIKKEFAKEGVYQIYSMTDSYICGGDTEKIALDKVKKESIYGEGDEFILITIRREKEGIMMTARVYVANDKKQLIVKRQFERIKTWDSISANKFGSHDILQLVKNSIQAMNKEDITDKKLTKSKKITREDIENLRKYAKSRF